MSGASISFHLPQSCTVSHTKSGLATPFFVNCKNFVETLQVKSLISGLNRIISAKFSITKNSLTLDLDIAGEPKLYNYSSFLINPQDITLSKRYKFISFDLTKSKSYNLK